jgi:NADH-quinone oxidoreductase subunit M
MDWINQNLLTILILLPLAGAVALVGHKIFWKDDSSLKLITLGFSIVSFLLSLLLLDSGKVSPAGFSYEVNVPWIKAIGTNYHLGIDGLSVWLVLLTTFIMPIAILSTWHAVEKRHTAFYVFLLLMETTMIGVFTSLDLLLFYLFFEASLIPMFFLIGIWGGDNRIYAAVKFFIYTAIGSLLMLVAIISLYFIQLKATGVGTFDYLVLMEALKSGKILFDAHSPVPALLFFAFAIAFSIKVPLFPFHTWLPDAHTEAPTAGSVILAAVLLKMGTYGLMRFNFTLFPEACREYAWIFIILAVIGIIYGALVAMVQPDIKRLVAYSSVSHMGFVMLGMFSFTEFGMQGALYQMLNHGISTGALFLLVGFIYERRHTRAITEFGGLANVMPNYTTLFVIVTMSSIGLPFLNGFVGEFMIMLGMWSSHTLMGNWNWIATMIAGTGVILAAVYLLWMVQRVFFGKITNVKNKVLLDLNWREIGLMLPLLFLMVFMGVYPKPFLSKAEVSVKTIQQRVSGGEKGGSVAGITAEVNNEAPVITAPAAGAHAGSAPVVSDAK